jgi:predicted GIY-YIG superfamily endonuclease
MDPTSSLRRSITSKLLKTDTSICQCFDGQEVAQFKRMIEMSLRDKRMASIYLYVLLLEDEKYYVGMTDDIGLRLWEHFKMGKKTGAAWTRKYSPLSVAHLSQHFGTMRDFKRLEKLATLRLARLKGFRNVRGGGFSLTTDDYPPAWDDALTNIPAADVSQMKPISKSELTNLMKGKFQLWKERRREGIAKQMKRKEP